MAHLVLFDALNLIRRLYAVQERPYLPLSDDVSANTRQQIITNTRQQLLQTLDRLQQQLTPSHAVLVFDGSNNDYRCQLYAGYKANRKPMPAILAEALPQLEEAVTQHGLYCYRQPQYEADDVIASIACKVIQHQQQVTIVSTDKGFLPLLPLQINMFDPFLRQHLNSNSVQEKFGVTPQQLVRFWSLVGDSTNNIPGVPGIGPKTAQELMALGDTLTTALEHPDCNKKLRAKILEHKEQIKVYMQVLTLQTQLQLGINLQQLRLPESQSASC